MSPHSHSVFDLEHLRLLFNQLFEVTGVSVELTDADGALLVQSENTVFCTAYLASGGDAASCCNRDRRQLVSNATECFQTVRTVCPFGLNNAVVPVVVDGCCL